MIPFDATKASDLADAVFPSCCGCQTCETAAAQLRAAVAEVAALTARETNYLATIGQWTKARKDMEAERTLLLKAANAAESVFAERALLAAEIEKLRENSMWRDTSEMAAMIELRLARDVVEAAKLQARDQPNDTEQRLVDTLAAYDAHVAGRSP